MGDRDCTPDSDEADKDIPPNNTIMVRGLAQHISENDIEDSIRSCGLQAKDIRLIRKKETVLEPVWIHPPPSFGIVCDNRGVDSGVYWGVSFISSIIYSC